MSDGAKLREEADRLVDRIAALLNDDTLPGIDDVKGIMRDLHDDMAPVV